MMAGSDFIKTSTGKESVNATLPFGVVMSWAIKDYYDKLGYKVRLYLENFSLFSSLIKSFYRL